MMRYSENYKTLQARMKRLPKIYEDLMYKACEGQAKNFIKKFQENLSTNKFKNYELNGISIQRKEELGYKKPEIPLYGKGKDDDKSYYNMFLYKRISKGMQVYPRWAKHHTSKLQLRHLLEIHENGCTIIVTEKMRAFLHYIGIHLKKTTGLIRIPPRPIKQRTYEETLRTLKRKTGKKRLKEAINDYIQFADKSTFKVIADAFVKGDYEAAGR
jgi:hypothetical protein